MAGASLMGVSYSREMLRDIGKGGFPGLITIGYVDEDVRIEMQGPADAALLAYVKEVFLCASRKQSKKSGEKE